MALGRARGFESLAYEYRAALVPPRGRLRVLVGVLHRVLLVTQRFHMQHAFWGPQYSDDQMRKTAQSAGLDVIECAARSAKQKGQWIEVPLSS